MSVTDAGELFRKTVKDALTQNLSMEAIWFDTSMTVLPGQDGQPQAVYVAWVSIPSAQIGERLSASMVFPPEIVGNHRQIVGAVEEALESLLKKRTEMLNQGSIFEGAVR